MTIYLVKKIQIALLLIKKVKILTKYSDFFNIFLEKRILELLEIININQYIIKSKKDK